MPPAYAQQLLDLPAPGTSVGLSQAFEPVLIKGINVGLDHAMKLDFIVDPGESGLSKDTVSAEATKLIKYFMAALAVPEDDLWVNLSPYEDDRIIPDVLGQTEMGRDMLAQDYLLKQITSSLIDPEDALGREFWDRIYKQAHDKYGTTDIPVDTFNKVWIMPARALVYEDGGKAVIVESRLKVMLETDYLALEKNLIPATDASSGETPMGDDVKAVIRDIVLPGLEEEVNAGRNFVLLRQIYNSLLLAHWFKNNFKKAVLNKVYADRAKIRGVDVDDKDIARKIYARYVASFKKGVYDYVKEEYDPFTQEMIPRKYFSGGETFNKAALDAAMVTTADRAEADMFSRKMDDRALVVTASFTDVARTKPAVVRNRLMDPLQTAYFMAYAQRTNPRHEPMRVMNGASGPSIMDTLLAFDATDIINVVDQDYDVGLLRFALEEWGQVMDKIVLRPLKESVKFRRENHYWWAPHVTRWWSPWIIVEELKRGGAIENSIEVEPAADGFELKFRWTYPGQKPKDRRVRFIVADLTAPAKYPQSLREVLAKPGGLDYYFQKSAMDVLNKRDDYLPQIARAVKRGVLISPFITEDPGIIRSVDLAPEFVASNGFRAESYQDVNTALGANFPAQEYKQYNWYLELWEKTSTAGLPREYTPVHNRPVITHIPVEQWQRFGDGKETFQVVDGRLFDEFPWVFTATSYRAVNLDFKITSAITRLYEEGRGRSADDPIVVLDWGCGEGTALTGLLDIVEILKQKGYPDLHVRAIGYSRDFYPSWDQVPLAVDMVVDEAKYLAEDLEHLGVKHLDLVFSRLGFTHFLHENRNVALNHLESLGRMLRPGGEIRMDVQEKILPGEYAARGLASAGKMAVDGRLVVDRIVSVDAAEQGIIRDWDAQILSDLPQDTRGFPIIDMSDFKPWDEANAHAGQSVVYLSNDGAYVLKVHQMKMADMDEGIVMSVLPAVQLLASRMEQAGYDGPVRMVMPRLVRAPDGSLGFLLPRIAGPVLAEVASDGERVLRAAEEFQNVAAGSAGPVFDVRGELEEDDYRNYIHEEATGAIINIDPINIDFLRTRIMFLPVWRILAELAGRPVPKMDMFYWRELSEQEVLFLGEVLRSGNEKRKERARQALAIILHYGGNGHTWFLAYDILKSADRAEGMDDKERPVISFEEARTASLMDYHRIMALTPQEIGAFEAQYPGYNWRKAAEVIWPELVRERGQGIFNNNQLTYFRNQAYVRRDLLFILRDLLAGTLSDEEYIKKMDDMHTDLLTVTGIYDPKAGRWHTSPREDLVRKVGLGEDDPGRPRAPFMFGADRGKEKLKALKALMESFLERNRPGRPADNVMADMARFYVDLFDKDALHIFTWTNHAWLMQIVNMMLRLHDLNGVEHGHFDEQYQKMTHNDDPAFFAVVRPKVVDMIRAANSGIDSAETADLRLAFSVGPERQGELKEKLQAMMGKAGYVNPEHMVAQAIAANRVLGMGGDTVLAVAGIADICLKAERGIRGPIFVPDGQGLQVVDNIMPGYNVGQPIARIGNVMVLLMQDGKPAGVPMEVESAYGYDIARIKDYHLNYLKTIADFPQASYDRFIGIYREIKARGHMVDMGTGQNLMVDAGGKQINFIDITDGLVPGEPAGELAGLLLMLIDANFLAGAYELEDFSGRGKNALVRKAVVRITRKLVRAFQPAKDVMEGFPAAWNAGFPEASIYDREGPAPFEVIFGSLDRIRVDHAERSVDLDDFEIADGSIQRNAGQSTIYFSDDGKVLKVFDARMPVFGTDRYMDVSDDDVAAIADVISRLHVMLPPGEVRVEVPELVRVKDGPLALLSRRIIGQEPSLEHVASQEDIGQYTHVMLIIRAFMQQVKRLTGGLEDDRHDGANFLKAADGLYNIDPINMNSLIERRAFIRIREAVSAAGGVKGSFSVFKDPGPVSMGDVDALESALGRDPLLGQQMADALKDIYIFETGDERIRERAFDALRGAFLEGNKEARRVISTLVPVADEEITDGYDMRMAFGVLELATSARDEGAFRVVRERRDLIKRFSSSAMARRDLKLQGMIRNTIEQSLQAVPEVRGLLDAAEDRAETALSEEQALRDKINAMISSYSLSFRDRSDWFMPYASLGDEALRSVIQEAFTHKIGQVVQGNFGLSDEQKKAVGEGAAILARNNVQAVTVTTYGGGSSLAKVSVPGGQDRPTELVGALEAIREAYDREGKQADITFVVYDSDRTLLSSYPAQFERMIRNFKKKYPHWQAKDIRYRAHYGNIYNVSRQEDRAWEAMATPSNITFMRHTWVGDPMSSGTEGMKLSYEQIEAWAKLLRSKISQGAMIFTESIDGKKFYKIEKPVGPDAVAQPVDGGIDFNAKNINIETMGRGADLALPDDIESMDLEDIEGLVPVIMNVTPIANMSAYLFPSS